MIAPAFAYARPTSLAEALDALREAGAQGRALAGGQSLLPLLKMRLTAPSMLVDLSRVPELHGITETADAVRVGAMTTHAEMLRSDVIRRAVPLAVQTAGRIADPQVRNRGTLGGSLAHADPAADWPAAVLAADAVLEIAGPSGRRDVAAADFFRGPFETALAPGEILVAVRWPKTDRSRSWYAKFAHPASGFAVVGVAAAFALDGDRALNVRIAVTGAGPRPFRARETESALEGQTLTDSAVRAAAQHAASGIEIVGDLFASAEWRRQLVSVMTARAVVAARG
jgi:carbon-monoxide dehydrogenase medium subunit